MERILIILVALFLGACAIPNRHAFVEDEGITVDYLGRSWAPQYQGYNERPQRIPESVVIAEMKHLTMDAGISDPRWLYLKNLEPEGEVIIASSFSPMLSVTEEPVSIPLNIKYLLLQTLEENRPYKMSDIPWPFAPPSQAYILLSKDISELISLTRYDNAFVLQHAEFASASYEEEGSPPEFQARGAWSTWVESPELAKFLDENFKRGNPQQTPFSKWLSDSIDADRIKGQEANP